MKFSVRVVLKNGEQFFLHFLSSLAEVESNIKLQGYTMERVRTIHFS